MVAESIAEQRLLWHLRRQHKAVLVHPEDLDAARRRWPSCGPRCRPTSRSTGGGWPSTACWSLLSALLILVPGPNVLGYYFAFRVVGHYFSMRGARQALDHVAWTTRPSDALADLRPLVPGRSATSGARAWRPSRRGWSWRTCGASSIAWPSPARDISHDCDACRPCRPSGLPPRGRRRDRNHARRHARPGGPRRPDVSRQSSLRAGRAADRRERRSSWPTTRPPAPCAMLRSAHPYRDVCRRAGRARSERAPRRRRASDRRGRARCAPGPGRLDRPVRRGWRRRGASAIASSCTRTSSLGPGVRVGEDSVLHARVSVRERSVLGAAWSCRTAPSSAATATATSPTPTACITRSRSTASSSSTTTWRSGRTRRSTGPRWARRASGAGPRSTTSSRSRTA